MVCPSLCQKNEESGRKGNLRCIRNTSGRKYYNDRYEVEKVVRDQGCGRLFYKSCTVKVGKRYIKKTGNRESEYFLKCILQHGDGLKKPFNLNQACTNSKSHSKFNDLAVDKKHCLG